MILKILISLMQSLNKDMEDLMETVKNQALIVHKEMKEVVHRHLILIR